MTESPDKSSKPRGAITNASWNAFSTIWSIAISFALAPLLIRSLGTDQYGILLLIWSVTGILGVMNFGMGEATLRYVALYFGQNNREGVNRVLGATLTFYLVICAITVTALLFGAPLLAGTFEIPAEQADLVAWLLRLSAVIFTLGVLSRAYGSIPMALHRYDISSKIALVQSIVRSGGYIALAMAGFGLLHIVAWDVVALVGTLSAQAIVIRRLAPGVKLFPALSFRGIREIIGFSVYSFLTYVFFMMHRESGKMMLGAQLGPTPVAHLGTPDNIAHRLHMVVASGSETLMPRFSATQDAELARDLLRNGTWSSLVVSLILLVPLIVLMPEFLALWISPEFARDSAAIGQLVALSYITQGAYAPAATYFRGTGKPAFVTIIVAAAGVTTLVASLFLIPRYGAIGVGYAYVLGSVPALIGTVHGWFHLFGTSSTAALLRTVVVPIVTGVAAFLIGHTIHRYIPPSNWIGIFVLGGVFAGITALLVIGADWVLGGVDAPSQRFVKRIASHRRLAPFLMRAKRAQS